MMGRRGDGVLLLVDGGGRDGRQDHLLMMLMMLLLLLMLVHGRRIGAAAVVAAEQLRVARIGEIRLWLVLSRRLLLGLHAPILEPDFDLSLSQAKGVGDLDATPARQVPIKVELFLQFQRLVARVRLASSLRVRHYIYKIKLHFFE